MDPAIALVLALSLTVPKLTVPDSPLRLYRSFCTSACTSSLGEKEKELHILLLQLKRTSSKLVSLCTDSPPFSSK